MSTSPQNTPSRSPSKFRRFIITVAQIGVIILIWYTAVQLSQRWLHGLPAGIAGLAIALALLGLGLLRREWVADGATWLLREMLLFFIPVVIAIIQYQDLMRQRGLAIFLVVVGSTACVMVATAFAVDLAWKLERRLRKDKETRA